MGKLKLLVVALARLHNFCINERIAGGESMSAAEQEMSNPMPSTPHLLDGTPIEANDVQQKITDAATPSYLKGMSAVREMMVTRVESLGLERPKIKF